MQGKQIKPTTDGDWREARLGDISHRVTKGTTPTTIGGRYTEKGISFVKVESITNEGRIDVEKLAHIDDETNFLLTRSTLQKDDVLFTIAGTIGRVARVSEKLLPANTNQAVAIVRPNQDIVDSNFLYYSLRDDARIERAHTRVVQSVQANFSLSELSAVEISLPSLPEQRAIAHVLGTLDDKIELNRRMNETLEEMARALFKSWFVDFDPVRAKMEGRWRQGESLPGLSTDLYDVFPDRLVPSELGEIPEGWEVGTLGDVAEPRRDGVRPELLDPDTPYIALEHMPKRCIALGDWSSAAGLASGKLRFERGDILFGKLRPYFHKVGIAPLNGVCSTDIVVMSPKESNWFGFVLGHVSSSAFVAYTDATSTGTKMPRTKWADMAQYKVALPDTRVAKAFDAMIQPSIESILSVIHESRSLAAQRDALLPKLMSGEVEL